MRAIYLDCFSGISGDMILGALIDLGLDMDTFRKELNKLNITGYDIHVCKKESFGIVGTDVNVYEIKKYVPESIGRSNLYHSHLNHHGSHHEGCHDHEHHDHEHHELHEHQERNLFDIETIIDNSNLSERVKYLSKLIFVEIAKAEAKVHNKDVYDVHFHEVGAIDSIVDIVGACICLDLLKIELVFASDLHEGTGFIRCAHGELPVPVPAVMEMLKGSNIPVVMENINTELVTPTGLGIVKTLAKGFGLMPKMYVEGVGYGLGKRDTGRFNALRVVMGTVFEEQILNQDISILEANIDDLSPQILGFAMEKLFENGALDVFYTPIFMKKNRPAYKLSVMCNICDEEKITGIIFSETSTIGIRKSRTERIVMDREIKSIDTEYGNARFKASTWGDITKITPEYDDATRIARENKIPLYKAMEYISMKAKEIN